MQQKRRQIKNILILLSGKGILLVGVASDGVPATNLP